MELKLLNKLVDVFYSQMDDINGKTEHETTMFVANTINLNDRWSCFD